MVERSEPGNRKNTGITIDPEVHAELKAMAASEDRTVSQLIEIMVRWNLAQMKQLGINSIELKSCSIRRPTRGPAR